MRIVNLIEDTDGTYGCRAEHGLSFYIETPGHRLLVDTGASAAFLENARKLGIDLGAVDTVILSHGHYDHGGGILAFAEQNPRAKIYLRKGALGEYFNVSDQPPRYIGLDERIAALEQIIFVEGDVVIDEELALFTDVRERCLWPEGNRLLKCRREGELFQDNFSHEQYLIIRCEGREILVSGCAHNGIINILERFRVLRGRWPDLVISGFHTMKKSGYTESDRELIRQIALQLADCPTKFYTGHCTGEEPYAMMHEIMGDQVQYVHSGEEIDPDSGRRHFSL